MREQDKVSFSEAERPALGPKASLWSSSWCSSGSKAPPVEHLDVDDSGDISVENLVALTGSKKKAEELIGEGDLDHSKTISYEEFKKLMHTAS